MNLYSQIIAVYPELTITPTYDPFFDGIIQLRDDGDGIQYIYAWNYTKPLPTGMKVGK